MCREKIVELMGGGWELNEDYVRRSGRRGWCGWGEDRIGESEGITHRFNTTLTHTSTPINGDIQSTHHRHTWRHLPSTLLQKPLPLLLI